MSSNKEFEAHVRKKYGSLKTVKSFLDLSIKAYDDNLDGLLKFLNEDNETLEENMLTEMKEETISNFWSKYKMNPQTLLRLTTHISDSLVEPLIEGYYDKTNDFGDVTNGKNKRKKKKQQKKKTKKAIKKSVSQKKETKEKKPKKHQCAQTNAVQTNNKEPKPPKVTKKKKKTYLSISEQKEQQKQREKQKKDLMTIEKEQSLHPLMTHQNDNKSFDDYLKAYFLKIHSLDGFTYPISWSCLFYHQMGADFEFDLLEDVDSEKEKSDILWKEWIDGKLCVNKCEYDSDDNKDKDNEDGNALLTQVPDFIFDFCKDSDICFDEFEKNRIYCYRIRRWISSDLQMNEFEKLKKNKDYSWIADKISYLDDYVLTDDLIVAQNENLLSTPTKFEWFELANSGFFEAFNANGLYSVIGDEKVNILQNGICAIGNFVFGKEPNDEQLDLYGIIRLDVMTPSFLRFPFYKSPILNMGKSVINKNVILCSSDCRLPVLRNFGLCFDNIQRYEQQRSNKDVAVRIDFKPLMHGKTEFSDIWTLFLCFCHPFNQQKNEKSVILFKSNCMELYVENKFDEFDKLICEELVFKIFSKNFGSRFVEIFRSEIVSNQAKKVNTLIMSFDGKKLFCALNGRQLSLTVDKMNRSNLFNLKKSSHLLLGHKCSSGDDGSPQNLFNGYLFELCIYNKTFYEFELRAFEQQCHAHIQKYCKILDESSKN